MDDTDTTRLSRRRLLALSAAGSAAAVAGCLGSDDEDGDAEAEAYVVVYHWGYALFDEDGDELDQLEVTPNTEVTLHTVNDHASDAFEHLPEPVADELKDFDALGRTRDHVESGRIEAPDDETIEAVYEEAHGGGHGHTDDDHGDVHDDDDGHGHNDDGHGDGHGHNDHGHDDGHGHNDHGHDDGHGHNDHGHDDGHGHDDDDHGHEDALLDHGFMISEFDVQADVEGDADEPATVSFVADEPGTYEATCYIYCGYGHAYHTRDILVVTDE